MSRVWYISFIFFTCFGSFYTQAYDQIFAKYCLNTYFPEQNSIVFNRIRRVDSGLYEMLFTFNGHFSQQDGNSNTIYEPSDQSSIIYSHAKYVLASGIMEQLGGPTFYLKNNQGSRVNFYIQTISVPGLIPESVPHLSKKEPDDAHANLRIAADIDLEGSFRCDIEKKSLDGPLQNRPLNIIIKARALTDNGNISPGNYSMSEFPVTVKVLRYLTQSNDIIPTIKGNPDSYLGHWSCKQHPELTNCIKGKTYFGPTDLNLLNYNPLISNISSPNYVHISPNGEATILNPTCNCQPQIDLEFGRISIQESGTAQSHTSAEIQCHCQNVHSLSGFKLQLRDNQRSMLTPHDVLRLGCHPASTVPQPAHPNCSLYFKQKGINTTQYNIDSFKDLSNIPTITLHADYDNPNPKSELGEFKDNAIIDVFYD